MSSSLKKEKPRDGGGRDDVIVRRREPWAGMKELLEEEEDVDGVLPPSDLLDLDDDSEHSKGSLKHSLRVPSIYSGRRVPSRKSLRSDSSLRYASIRSIFIDFCNRTSSHGVPFFGSNSFFGKIVWVMIFLCALTLFLIQTYWTMSEYFQYRTIIEMQLKFEPAPFPAATVCNLNAFKYSALRTYKEIAQAFELFETMVNARADDEAERLKAWLGTDLAIVRISPPHGPFFQADAKEEEKKSKLNAVPIRKKRNVVYAPVFVRCTCIHPHDQCVPQRNPLELNASVCMCYEDVNTGDIWPCYPTTVWTVKKCTQCSLANTCVDPDRPNATLPHGETTTCLCQSVSNFCVVHPKDEIRWWNPNNYTVQTVTKPPPTPEPALQEAFGYTEERKDKGAITTQTRENIIFIIAALPKETRKELSYTLEEFVLRCSFNSKDCNMEKDFQLHMDPEYGNCYTFNFNDSVKMKNSRAGPMYGLRLLLNVNQSDYMPTTEAAGVRLVVHEQHQEPFPDTFGYSAPTGFVSSFGLKTVRAVLKNNDRAQKVLHRLNEPYGQCSDEFRPEGYIYDEHYSPEGCYRNCFQHRVIEKCGCGDPRFPLPSDEDDEHKYRHCNAQSPLERSFFGLLFHENFRSVPIKYLNDDGRVPQTTGSGFLKGIRHSLIIGQLPAWPAVNFNIGTDCPAVFDITNDTEKCTEYYRVNTAYIEIYYEQLNFENLRETAGYTLVNLFSDFGGNIGLWIGFSVITVAEIVELGCEFAYYLFWLKPMRLHKKMKRKREEKMHRLSRPRIFYKGSLPVPGIPASARGFQLKHELTTDTAFTELEDN